MGRRAVGWSSLIVAVTAPIAFFHGIQHQGSSAFGNADGAEGSIRGIWAICMGAELFAITLAIVACSRGGRSNPQATPQAAVAGAIAAILGALLLGLFFRPGA